MPVKAPILSYLDLKARATELLNRVHPTSALPIPIEQIVEFKLGIDIVCQMSLQHVCGVDAFVSHDGRTIYVDAEVYLSRNLNRYRFSLAHELAHAVLHAEVMRALSFNTMQEWKAAIQSIPDTEYSWMEWQAYTFAGLVLVPPSLLPTELEAVRAEATTRLKGGPQEQIHAYVEQLLADRFEVSVPVIQRRLAKDHT